MQEIINAALEPLRSTEAWYGIFVALAMTKQIKKLTNQMMNSITERYGGDGETP